MKRRGLEEERVYVNKTEDFFNNMINIEGWEKEAEGLVVVR